MKTQLLICFLAAVLCRGIGIAQPVVLSILQIEDNESKEISISQSETVEFLTAFDFYGASSIIVIQKGDAEMYVSPGYPESGKPHCVPYPLILAGPAKISIDSGDTSGERTESTPLLVTLKIDRAKTTRAVRAKKPKAKPVE